MKVAGPTLICLLVLVLLLETVDADDSYELNKERLQDELDWLVLRRLKKLLDASSRLRNGDDVPAVSNLKKSFDASSYNRPSSTANNSSPIFTSESPQSLTSYSLPTSHIPAQSTEESPTNPEPASISRSLTNITTTHSTSVTNAQGSSTVEEEQEQQQEDDSEDIARALIVQAQELEGRLRFVLDKIKYVAACRLYNESCGISAAWSGLKVKCCRGLKCDNGLCVRAR